MTEREFATDVVARLQKAGFVALFAGGCVRDELLGLVPADHDVATSATPEQVKAHFRRCHSFGASFGVVEVLGPRDAAGEWLKVQVATFRTDGDYTDGRRPDAVVFSSPREDAERRDFTVNGLFLDPLTGEVIDHVGGRADLDAKVLRAIGDPAKRFAEDKLRLLRAVRMAARFELTVDPATFAAARAMADDIRVVSAERIADEFRKMLVNRHRARAVRLFAEFGLVGPVLPEVAATFEDSHRVLAELSGDVSFELAFAALLAPAGCDPEPVGRRLRLSNEEIARIAWLAKNATALRDASAMPKSRLYPILAHPGAGELLALHRAAGISTDFCEAVLRDTPANVLTPPPLLTGDDLRAMGFQPGPAFKRILDALRDAQLDDRVRTRTEAEHFVRAV
jgi:poly(A) polymerase